MSSNMIKAYSIAYDTKKLKNLDIEDRESAILKRVQSLLSVQDGPEKSGKNSGFVQGLMAEDLGEIDFVQEDAVPEVSEQDIENIKNSLREEIMAEMMPIMNRKGDDIIANARAQADGLLVAAKQSAESAKEDIFNAASAQGYEEGKKRAKIEEEKALAELEAKRIQLEHQYATKIAELEPAFLEVLVKLVKKLTNVAYDSHKEVLLYLMETGLEFAQKDTYFDVVLSAEDYQKYSSLFPKIKEAYKEKYELEFVKDAELPNGSCKLENQNRVIDCGLGVRLSGLLEELSLLG